MKLKDLLEGYTFTGEPYISYEDMGNAASTMYARWAREYKEINKKLKGTGEYELKNILGTDSKKPVLILYKTRNKKNNIVITEGHYEDTFDLHFNIGITYSSIDITVNSNDIYDIKKGLVKLRGEIKKAQESGKYKQFEPFNFPKFFKEL